MKVKICGLKEAKDVEAAIEAGVDFIGFVFAPSKRQITKKDAHELAKKIPKRVKIVGVFVDAPLEEVLDFIKSVPLDLVQCHGNESVAYLNQLPVPAIKAFGVQSDFSLEKLKPYADHYLLLDAPIAGNGETFEWNNLHIPVVYQKQLFLAGGLTASNVQSAIRYFHPLVVDVSSGVETNQQKDPQKIKEFIKKAKEVA